MNSASTLTGKIIVGSFKILVGLLLLALKIPELLEVRPTVPLCIENPFAALARKWHVIKRSTPGLLAS